MEITFVNNNQGAGDWQGVYVDGSLMQQGHALDYYAILCLLKDTGQTIKVLQRVTLNDAQMESLGNRLPNMEADFWKYDTTL